jgi:hypothetical protein
MGRGAVRQEERGGGVTGSRENGLAAQAVPPSGSAGRPEDFAGPPAGVASGTTRTLGTSRPRRTVTPTGRVTARDKIYAASL